MKTVRCLENPESADREVTVVFRALIFGIQGLSAGEATTLPLEVQTARGHQQTEPGLQVL